MKYPADQYQILLQALKQLAPLYDLKQSNPNTLHYVVYQQLCKAGQDHNKLYVYGQELKRYGNLTDAEKQVFQPLINIDFDFKYYPDGCNDSHVGTAMKHALTELF
jgi:hypothetical protein